MGHHSYSEHGHNSHQSGGYNAFYGYQGQHGQNKILTILNRIRENRKLKFLLITAFIVVLSILVLLVILLFPMIVKLFNYIMQNGLQGAWDSLTGFVDKAVFFTNPNKRYSSFFKIISKIKTRLNNKLPCLIYETCFPPNADTG